MVRIETINHYNYCGKESGFSNKINEWLEEHPKCKIIDIKYVCEAFANCTFHSAMIMYEPDEQTEAERKRKIEERQKKLDEYFRTGKDPDEEDDE